MLAAPLLFALLGLAMGSFGNVLIVRIRHAESLGGRSHCPSCRRTIPWFDLVPVVSFIVLGGRCRHCRRDISVQYPLVEAGSLLVFLFAWAILPLAPLHALLTALVLYFLLLACVYDGLYQQIPDLFTLLMTIVAAFDFFLIGGLPLLAEHLAGALVPLGWFGLQWLGTRGRAVGTGDIFLGGALGFWLGLPEAVEMLVLSYMVGACIVAVLLLCRRISFKNERIAFGPFLGVATLLTLLGAGDAYLAFFH